MRDNDIRSLGYVLRRTNHGEADRILNIITPEKKISVIAKGARRERSKLAGGIEMFTLSDFNVHFGKGNLGVLTSAKMVKHHGEIAKDYNKVELSAMILRKVSFFSDNFDSPEYFKIVDQSLRFINNSNNLKLVEAWSFLKLKKIVGEEINLYRDVDGELLERDKKYSWDSNSSAFLCDENGKYGENEIKMLRIMVGGNLEVAGRVKTSSDMIEDILRLVRAVI